MQTMAIMERGFLLERMEMGLSDTLCSPALSKTRPKSKGRRSDPSGNPIRQQCIVWTLQPGSRHQPPNALCQDRLGFFSFFFFFVFLRK